MWTRDRRSERFLSGSGRLGFGSGLVPAHLHPEVDLACLCGSGDLLGSTVLTASIFFWVCLFRTAAAAHQQLLQVDLEMNVLVGPEWTQEVTWQLEYPLTQTVTPEVTTHIHLAQQHLGGIVPLAMVRRSSHTHTHRQN